jgi:2-phosphosulfolactate phosphatase
MNSKAVASAVIKKHHDETILLVCSGSSGKFCLEDLYGAGYFLSCLLEQASFALTDAAKAALLFYERYKDEASAILEQSFVGQMLMEYGFGDEIEFVSQKSVYSVIPTVENGKIVRLEGHSCQRCK